VTNNAAQEIFAAYWDLELLLSLVAHPARLLAIGERKRSFGASKIKVSDDRWFDLMAQSAEKSEVNFLVPFVSPSTLEECVHLLTVEKRRLKTVLFMPPSFFGYQNWRSEWERARKRLKRQNIFIPRYRSSGAIICHLSGNRSFVLPSLGMDLKYIRFVVGHLLNAIHSNDASAFIATIQTQQRSWWEQAQRRHTGRILIVPNFNAPLIWPLVLFALILIAIFLFGIFVTAFFRSEALFGPAIALLILVGTGLTMFLRYRRKRQVEKKVGVKIAGDSFIDFDEAVVYEY
jgi:hypothetical protein